MNLLFISEDHSVANGGVTTVVSQLADELVLRCPDLRLRIVATGNDAVHQHARVSVELVKPTRVGKFWRWSPALQKKIDNILEAEDIDVIHIHGIWTAVQWMGLLKASKRKIPHILSAHGMLEPWFWGGSASAFKRFKKMLYLRNVFFPVVSRDAIIHAITPLEQKNLQRMFPHQEVIAIPNAIAMNEKDENSPFLHSGESFKNIVYLGRIHPKKGIDLLIRAFHRVSFGMQWQLIIAGQEESPSYLHSLQQLISELELTSQVHFTGPVYGGQKWDLLRKAWVMVAPSYSEVMGMVNLEAAKCHTPSITTWETGLLDWESGGGISVHPNVEELARALHATSRWTPTERTERGEKSYQFVKQKYSWDAVFPLWEKLYKEMALVRE